VRDRAKAGHFYASVLGCALDPLPEGAALLSVEDRAFAVIDGLSDDERARGIPDHWRLYLVKGSKARRGGASPRELAVPGAQLAATQAAIHFGARCTAGREAVLWTELGAGDSIEISTLLQAAINEPLDADAPGDTARPIIYCNDGESTRVGTLIGTVDSHGTEVANLCLTVADCAGALARARRAGATIVGGPAELATSGRLAAVIDPQGVPVYFWQPSVSTGVRTKAGAGTTWSAAIDAPPPRMKLS
jgi:predicted enzyme related to lactoylglutathione lyase